MNNILDADGSTLATIGDDGRVKDIKGLYLGKVALNGEVYNEHGQKVGYFLESGYIYKGTSHVGTVRSDGNVVDYEGTKVGKVVGGHTMLGGAALILLVR